jgi:hypothetical protein
VDDRDRKRVLERELVRIETMYQNVTGVAGRLKWRREREEVKKAMASLGNDSPAPEAARSLGVG